MVNVNDATLHESLSAVMDGQATAADWARVRAAWDEDPGLRERWLLWSAAADGLRGAELQAARRQGDALLAALHEHVASPQPAHAERRGWWAPLAVAASFVVFALGFTALRPEPSSTDGMVAAVAPDAPSRAPGLAGLSFAEAAAGPALAAEAPPQASDWGLTLPERAASAPP